ncbi:darcynin family protein [Geothrix sp. PMB-07]|uniref:darcynin family protein n=1 Tax=Geothrix sp. PMB-07 TaxID=3068640 RepID=UPI002741C4C6|nr:darcynin family protein [Geothrix sp. PMB-07]WLT30699.1 darcynin family protein [Geothrix sp. PMB-07]
MNTCFLLVNALPAWLRLSRAERQRLFESELLSLVPKHPGLTLRFFDAEAYSAVCSDILMIQPPDARALHFFMEGLRDSALLTEPYFEVRHIIPCLENGFQEYEKALAGV